MYFGFQYNVGTMIFKIPHKMTKNPNLPLITIECPETHNRIINVFLLHQVPIGSL